MTAFIARILGSKHLCREEFEAGALSLDGAEGVWWE